MRKGGFPLTLMSFGSDIERFLIFHSSVKIQIRSRSCVSPAIVVVDIACNKIRADNCTADFGSSLLVDLCHQFIFPVCVYYGSNEKWSMNPCISIRACIY